MNGANKKSGPVVLVIDYGASNLRSVQKAFAKLGYEARVSGEAGDIAAADALVLPGQGAAKPTMQGLRERGLVEPVLNSISEGRPFFGVCMGLQVLFDFSAEGDQECLGVLPGSVERLPKGVKAAPHGLEQCGTEPHQPPLQWHSRPLLLLFRSQLSPRAPGPKSDSRHNRLRPHLLLCRSPGQCGRHSLPSGEERDPGPQDVRKFHAKLGSGTEMEVIPAIDLKAGRCVRLLQGDFDKETVFSTDPGAVARGWEQAGAPRIHVVDLEGAASGRPENAEAVARILKAWISPSSSAAGSETWKR